MEEGLQKDSDWPSEDSTMVGMVYTVSEVWRLVI